MKRLVRLVRIRERRMWTMPENDLDFTDIAIKDRGNGGM
jgi:hypothetical protein